MANFERGVYEPGDEVRVFDGAEEDDDVEGSRLPLLIVLALLVLAMFGGVVWLAYTQGVARGRGETPVLTAAAGPERVAPQQPGGANVPYQNFKIYEQPAPSDDASDSAPAKQAPEKQVPAQAVVETPMPKSFTPPAPPPVLKPDVKVAATPATDVAKETKPAPAPAKPVIAAAKPVAKPAPPPAKPAAAPPKSVASLIQQAGSSDSVVNAPVSAKKTPPPALKQAVATPTPAPVVSSGPASGAPRQLGQPVTAQPATPAPKPAAAAKSGGSYILQIGAYKSQGDADAAWKAYKAKHAALLSGYSSDIQQADLGEKGTWYRLRIAGFADRDGAAATCDRLKADGGGCFLGK